MTPLHQTGPSRIRPVAAFTLVELLAVLAITAVLVGLLLPTLGRSQSKGNGLVCVNHLRQLGLAVRLYADENRDRMPSAEILPSDPVDPPHPLPRIRDVLAEFVGKMVGTNRADSGVFRCPTERSGRFEREGSSYEWNAHLNGRRLDEIQTSSAFLILPGGITNFFLVHPPETIPLLLDYDPVHPRPPKSGKNVAYMDGHVGPLTTTQDPSP